MMNLIRKLIEWIMRILYHPRRKEVIPCDTCYGLLYNWYAVGTGKLAPTGWHVPTETEWTTLTDYLINNGYGYGGSGTDIAKSLAVTTNWPASEYPGTLGNDPGTNNSSGFSGLPGGYRVNTGYFSGIGSYGYWWSSTEYDAYYAWDRRLNYNSAYVVRGTTSKVLGYSVRCLRDSTDGWTEGDHMTDIDGNQYDTIQLGTQIWTVQNLAVTHYNDEEAIPNVTDYTAWAALTTGALCAYNNDWDTI